MWWKCRLRRRCRARLALRILFNLVLVIVNLDPSNAQATVVHWNMDLLGLTGDSFVVDDQITGNSFSWNRDSFVSLDPRGDYNNVAHIAVVRIP